MGKRLSKKEERGKNQVLDEDLQTMKKRKSRSGCSKTSLSQKEKIGKTKNSRSETQILRRERRQRRPEKETEIGEEKGCGGGGGGFFACYLLTSLSPRHKGHTYIGFTVNPRRRIRQHNGEIGSGARRTKAMRPWEMAFCIYGFPTNVSALQFEWAWQKPKVSRVVSGAAATFKSLSGLANKIKLGYTMLTLPAWCDLKLTVNFFSTKYTKHSAGCPTLPDQMRVQVGSIDELPCYTGTDDNNNNMLEDEDEDEDELLDDETSNNMNSVYGSPSKESTYAEVDCPSLPENMGVQVGSMDELPCDRGTDDDNMYEDKDEWDDETCNDISNPLSKGSTIAKVDSCRDHWSGVEEITSDQEGGIGEIATSPPRVSSLFPTSTLSSFEDKDEWDDETCNGIINYVHGPLSEGSTIAEVDSCRDHWRSIEETTRDQNGGVEETATSPLRVSSLFPTSMFSALGGVENRDVIPTSRYVSRVKFNQLASKTVRAVDTDQPPIRSRIFPREDEVIDLLSPSPAYKRSKKVRVSNVSPNIVDLTTSPILI